MPEIFFISDTHFGHKNILKYESDHRPFSSIEEHDEEIIKRWNSVVKKQDIVYHLGDIVFGARNLPLISRLNGNINLLLGNHDMFRVERYLEAGITKVIGERKFKEGILSHAPLHTNQVDSRFKYNIHGHMHSKFVKIKNMNAWREGPTYFTDERYINVSCEQIDFTPINWSELKRRVIK